MHNPDRRHAVAAAVHAPDYSDYWARTLHREYRRWRAARVLRTAASVFVAGGAAALLVIVAT